MKRVCVIGCWHQGVVGAACLADLGHDVLAADHDAARIRRLGEGRAPLYEPGLDELIGKGLQSGRLRFSAEPAAAVRDRSDILIMFDTPVDEKDQSDLTEILKTAGEIAPNLEPDAVILVTAQVPVGTCEALAAEIRRKNPAARFGIAYSPENLRLGQAIERFLHPALPVIGANDPATLDRVEQLLAPMQAKWERVNLRTAEMTKHALNAFLATSICFANELGNLCDEVGADGCRIAEVLRREPRVGPKAMLFPGLGFSGGTLARDMQTLRGLGDRAKLDTPLLDGAWNSNQQQNRLVVRKLKKALGKLTGRKVAVLGLTYKPDTSTLRRSVALEIIGDLVREKAAVSAHDPKADRGEVAAQSGFQFFDDPYAAAEGVDALVVITGWPEYKTLDFQKIKKAMAGAVLIDCNNMLDGDALARLGFAYLNVGRGRGAA